MYHVCGCHSECQGPGKGQASPACLGGMGKGLEDSKVERAEDGKGSTFGTSYTCVCVRSLCMCGFSCMWRPGIDVKSHLQ